MVLQPGTAQCLGQYVAVCATQECGYFGANARFFDPHAVLTQDSYLTVNLERYFGHPNLMLTEYLKRGEFVYWGEISGS